jgi:hypothetical protein
VSNGDGTVTDNATGLVWEQTPDGTTYALSGARGHCEGLSLGGRDDWRLPSVLELQSIVDYRVSSPALDTTVFLGLPKNASSNTWSSTPMVGDTEFARMVDFDTGTSLEIDPEATALVRCVRGVAGGAAAPGKYSVDNGTVHDASTKLTWQQGVSPDETLTWGSPNTVGTAQHYCSTLDLNGGGWRLPTLNELETLVDYTAPVNSRAQATIDIASFPNTPPFAWFWSATPLASDPSQAWDVEFGSGSNGWAGMSFPFYVRCVR